jgi:hypothetical protein
MTLNGTCEVCDLYSRPNSGNFFTTPYTSCITDVCESDEDQCFIDERGRWDLCELFYIVDESGHECVLPTCQEREYHGFYGTCRSCPEYSYVTNSSCIGYTELDCCAADVCDTDT